MLLDFVAVAGIVAGAGILGYQDSEATSLVIFFYVLLPVTNALADWVSLAITRWFLSGSADADGLGKILLRSLGDLSAALLCLFGLLATLVGVLSLWGIVSPATQPVDAFEYWQQIRAHPAQGTALYLMVATTLLPTFVHFLLGLWAMFAHKGRRLSDQATRLEAFATNGNIPGAVARDEIIQQVKIANRLGFLLALLACGLIFMLLVLPFVLLLF